MNTKEIAQAVGKDITTIQRWIRKLNGKMPSINGKMPLSSPMNPADFTLEETIAIIEQGLGKNAAALFRTNAETFRVKKPNCVTVGEIDSSSPLTVNDKPLKDMTGSEIDLLFQKILKPLIDRQNVQTDVLNELLGLSARQTLAVLSQKQQLLLTSTSDNIRWFTIQEYASENGFNLAGSAVSGKIGQEAAYQSRVKGYEIKKRDSKSYGQINVYREDILREVFNNLSEIQFEHDNDIAPKRRGAHIPGTGWNNH